jgi:hypothetical protein
MSLIQYSKECLEQYGAHTCILYETFFKNYQIHILDNQQIVQKYINKHDFYKIIPTMLQQTYTVIIVELKYAHHEITAVHLPKQLYLITPPIIY